MRRLLAILATALVAQADDKTKTPVVVPVQGGGTATTSKFGDGYITRDSTTTPPANPASSNVIVLPARK